MATKQLIEQARALVAQLQHLVPDDDPDLAGVSSAELEARCEAKLAEYRAARAGQPSPLEGLTSQQAVDWLERTYLGQPRR
jgi:hypothetical protein